MFSSLLTVSLKQKHGNSSEGDIYFTFQTLQSCEPFKHADVCFSCLLLLQSIYQLYVSHFFYSMKEKTKTFNVHKASRPRPTKLSGDTSLSPRPVGGEPLLDWSLTVVNKCYYHYCSAVYLNYGTLGGTQQDHTCQRELIIVEQAFVSA